ncbi:hypothetical protein J6590_102094 [Homalodisca vitripennis]|nr:hypothetical protein J6590_102094 [Homalodisca vitripennis]
MDSRLQSLVSMVQVDCLKDPIAQQTVVAVVHLYSDKLTIELHTTGLTGLESERNKNRPEPREQSGYQESDPYVSGPMIQYRCLKTFCYIRNESNKSFLKY